MLKISILTSLALCIGLISYGQENLKLMKLKSEKIAELPPNDEFTVIDERIELLPLDTRYDIVGYKPLKLDEYQVISSHQPNSNFDIVYFIDKSGNTYKKVWTTTAPQNFYPSGMASYDSMNPYGSTDMESAILNGILSTFLRQGLGIK